MSISWPRNVNRIKPIKHRSSLTAEIIWEVAWIRDHNRDLYHKRNSTTNNNKCFILNKTMPLKVN